VKAFVIKSVLLRPAGPCPQLADEINNSDAMATVLNTGSGVIRIGDLGKPYPTPWPLWMLSGGPQVNDTGRGGGLFPANRGVYGAGYIGNVMRWADELPIPINTLEVLEVELSWNPGINLATLDFNTVPNEMTLTFVLYGLLKRQVA
jgi:hypothetical protein